MGSNVKLLYLENLPKFIEETIKGTLDEIFHYYQDGTGKAKGEIVMVIAGKK